MELGYILVDIFSKTLYNMTRKYKVYDTTGTWLRTFSSYKEAHSFCLSRGRMDWQIK